MTTGEQAVFIVVNLSIWFAFMALLTWPLVHLVRTGRNQGAVLVFYVVAAACSQRFVGIGWFIILAELGYAVGWVSMRWLCTRKLKQRREEL